MEHEHVRDKFKLRIEEELIASKQEILFFIVKKIQYVLLLYNCGAKRVCRGVSLIRPSCFGGDSDISMAG